MLSPGFIIKNNTIWPLQVSLNQVGPLYHGVILPGESFTRTTGAVWFTIKVSVFLDEKDRITTWDCLWPIGKVTGAVLIAAITGGAAAYAGGAALAAAGAAGMVGVTGISSASALATATAASALVGAGFNAGASLIIAGVVVIGTEAASVSTVSAALEDIFSAQNCSASKIGCYAGPPWPFRTDVKEFTVEGGPTYQQMKTSDGKYAVTVIGNPLQIKQEGDPTYLESLSYLGHPNLLDSIGGNIIGITKNKQLCYTELDNRGQWTGWKTLQEGIDFIAIAVTENNDILAVGADNNLYSISHSGEWTNVQYSCDVTNITVMPEGWILGITKDKRLSVRASLNSAWIPAQNNSVDLIAITTTTNKTTNNGIYAVGTDNILYFKPDLNSNWQGLHPLNLDNNVGVIDICVLDNGMSGLFLAVGTDNNLYKSTDQQNWCKVKVDGGIIGVAQV